MNKTAFAISIGLTTFLLIAVAGVVFAVRASAHPQTSVAPVVATMEAAPTADVAISPDQALLQTFSEREAKYQELIAQANARLAQLQQQQQSLQAQLAAQQVATPAATLATITPDQAAAIAANFLGQNSIFSIELVSISGVNTYQVTFSSGDIVYVNMTGQVVGSSGPSFSTVWSEGSSSGNTAGNPQQPGYQEHENGGDD